jgi:hypothetical protein
MDDDATTPGKANLGALAAAAGGLLTFIGTVSLTGPLGRVVRNDPAQLKWALFAVLLGAALLVAGGLSITGKFLEVVLSMVGLELTLAGFVIAAVLAVRAGEHHERPSITAALDESGRTVKGKVSLGTLESRSRVVTVIQGVVVRLDGKKRTRDLSRSDVGPNEEGKVDLDFTARLPAGRYDSVRVAAWTVGTDGSSASNADVACKDSGEPESDDTPSSAGRGCVELPLAPVPTSPALEANWVDTKTDLLSLHVTASNASGSLSKAEGKGARVAVVAEPGVSGKGSPFYRAVLRPDPDGKLDMTFKVPVPPGPRRICVAAKYLAKDAPLRISCAGRFDDRQGRLTLVQLTRRKGPTPTPDS